MAGPGIEPGSWRYERHLCTPAESPAGAKLARIADDTQAATATRAGKLSATTTLSKASEVRLEREPAVADGAHEPHQLGSALQSMEARVLRPRDYLEVLVRVVRLVAIVMVDRLVRFEQAPESVLDEHAMQRVQALGVRLRMRRIGAAVAVATALAGRDDSEQTRWLS